MLCNIINIFILVFKKRYRWNGYYNETLGTVEKW